MHKWWITNIASEELQDYFIAIDFTASFQLVSKYEFLNGIRKDKTGVKLSQKSIIEPFCKNTQKLLTLFFRKISFIDVKVVSRYFYESK